METFSALQRKDYLQLALLLADKTNEAQLYGDDETLLIHAVEGGDATAAQVILGSGVDKSYIDEVDTDGFTALSVAAFHNHSEICEQLLKAGADPNIANRFGQSVADVAKEYSLEGTIAVLAKYGINAEE